MITFSNDAATDAAIKQRLMTATVSRSLSVTINGVSVPSANIVSDSLNLKNIIMDEETLVFGGCIPSQMKLNFFNLRSVISISAVASAPVSVTLNVSYLDGNGDAQAIAQPLFTGYVYSVRTMQKRAYTEIIAYDELYRMAQTKCKNSLIGIFNYSPSDIGTLFRLMRRTLELYDGLYSTDFESQLVARGSGFQYALSPLLQLGMSKSLFEQYADDDLTICDILRAHSELNAQFAYIAGDGTLQFAKMFTESNINGNTTVSKKDVCENIAYYQNLFCEDYTSAPVRLLWFPYNGDQRFVYGSTNDKRFWYVSDNIITKCITNQSVVSALVTNFHQSADRNYIFGTRSTYRPVSMTTFGEFWLECGDRVTASLKLYNNGTGQYSTETADSFVLQREIKGIANLKVSLEAKGSEYLTKDEVEV